MGDHRSRVEHGRVLAILTFYLTTRVCATAIYGAMLGQPRRCGVTETLSWLNRGAPWLLWPLAIVLAFFIARAILRDLR